MTPRRLRVLLVSHSYGGNGGIKSEHPDVRDWMIETCRTIWSDPRCELIQPQPRKWVLDLADTPIPMLRNRSVVMARKLGADVLCSVDSDMAPDLYLGHDPAAKPFWREAFDFLYKHWDHGPVVVGAPYVGPLPRECPYVFRWRNQANRRSNPDCQLEMYTREEAQIMGGIQDCAALPTGLIAYDMRIFDLLEPSGPDSQGWFNYEWTDKYAQEKASTEDVMATRNMSFVGCERLGYNPVHCAWDSWAGHWKPYCAEKPIGIRPEEVSRSYADALRRLPQDTKLVRAESTVSDDYITKNLVEDTPPDPVSRIRFQTPQKDLQILKGLVKRLSDRHDRPLQIVEVGSFIGESALAMAEALGPRGGTIYCVDTWEGSASDKSSESAEMLASVMGHDALYKTFLHETQHLREIIRPVRGESVKVANDKTLWAQDFQADLIFIDADHLYDSVKADIEAWRPHLAPDGILCGHDYGLFEGVRQAVHETIPQGYDVENLIWSYDFGRHQLNGKELALAR